MSTQPETGRLARALQWMLALEIAALGPGLGAVYHAGIISGGAWLGIAAGLYVGTRALAVASNFFRTHLHRSPRMPAQQIGLVKSLRLYCGDLYTAVIVYSVLF
ncbi:MAG: hypothetical protein ACRES4_09010, partial [Nevskiales bacterium]